MVMIGSRPLFSLGQLVATPGALILLASLGLDASTVLRRHVAGDWGDLDPDDAVANDTALLCGSRLLSSYQLTAVDRLWVITEGEDDDGVRLATTLLMPSEY